MRFRTPSLAITLLLLNLGCGPSRWVKQGDTALADNRPGSAAQAYQKALDAEPGHTDALRGMAAAHLARHTPVRAIVPAQRAAKTGDIRARELLGQALIEAGRADDAIRAIRKGLEAQPDHLPFRMLLVRAQIGAGEVEEAAKSADELLMDHAKGPTRGLHAWALARADRNDDAVAIASEAIALAPDDPMVQSDAAAVFLQTGHKAEYASAKAAALSFLPSNAGPMIQDAKRMQNDGDKEGAIRHLARAFALYPDNAESLRVMGLLYAERKAWTRAATTLNKAMNMAPFSDNPEVSGVRIARAGDQTVASHLRKQISEMANQLGESYAQTGQAANAAAAWEYALVNQSKKTAAEWIDVAKAWETSGNVDRTGKAARKAIELEPGNSAAHHVLARALSASGNPEWAIRHARKAWEIAPEDLNNALFLGGLYEQRGERRIAREIYRDALRRHPSDARVYSSMERVGGYRR